jgi:cation transporter-like permease
MTAPKRSPEEITALIVQEANTKQRRWNSETYRQRLWNELVEQVGSLDAGIMLAQMEETWEMMVPSDPTNARSRRR